MRYKWKQLSMWDAPREEFHVEYKKVNGGLSSGVCTFLLVNETYPNNDGYIRSNPVLKVDVTDEMLEEAGKP